MNEIEVKFLNVDVEALEAKLVSIGAMKIFDRLYRRCVYDYPDLRLNAANAWVRVRDEGDQVTMAFKQRQDAGVNGASDGGMQEVEMIVSNFPAATEFLERIGLTLKFYEENKRTRYILEDIEFDIDTWPLLEPYLEIEARSEARIAEAITLLELDPLNQKILTAFQIYEMNGINELDFLKLTFEEQVRR